MPQNIEPSRSWLFTPGTRPERFAKAGEVGADILIIDLEDAVSPADKGKARQIALEYLTQKADGPRRTLRINGLDTAAGIADLHALLGSGADPDFIVLPKTETWGRRRDGSRWPARAAAWSPHAPWRAWMPSTVPTSTSTTPTG